MNYRHIFHAGNFADVHKHMVLLALLERFKRKDKPMFVLDTHAGAGTYDLTGVPANRSKEWRDGIARLVSRSVATSDLQRFVEAQQLPTDASLPQRYRGSPALIVDALRPGDRTVFVEQQSDIARTLQAELPRRKDLSVICGDGYAALKAYLPPKERRGLVLIDPPYESDREFVVVENALRLGMQRWSSGIFALWYPIKAGSEVRRLHAALKDSGLRNLLIAELNVRPADSPIGLNGSGLIIANPPWQLETELRESTRELHALLAPDRSGDWRVEWLVPESIIVK